jgi:uncharacterized protein
VRAGPQPFPPYPFHTNQRREKLMGFDQYHEPAEELSQKVRTFARMITSLIEEAEAISWYEQRMSVEKDAQARAIMKNAQSEEFKHFGMNLEFLLRQKKDWRAELKEILFTTGDIVKRGEAGEKKAD